MFYGKVLNTKGKRLEFPKAGKLWGKNNEMRWTCIPYPDEESKIYSWNIKDLFLKHF
jgi:hypothetical protein